MASNSNYTSTSNQNYATTSSTRPASGTQFHFPPGYAFQYANTSGWYYNDVTYSLPAPPTIIATRSSAENVTQLSETTNTRRSRKQKQQEAQDDSESSSPAVEETLPPPPHDPDDISPVQVMRPCSMAGANISLNIRCAALLKADYPYLMCESCRTRFKLAELRNNGVRYEGKFLAKELPGEPRKGRGRGKKAFKKPRPQLIEYKGELVLDPAYMTTFQLDPKVFSAQASVASATAQEEAAFLKALRNAKKSFKVEAVDGDVQENIGDGDEAAANEGVDGDMQTPIADDEVMVTIEPSSVSNATGEIVSPSASAPIAPIASSTAANTSADTTAKSSNDPLDGLMRVRICSVKNCHNPIPSDYFWKMCENCRILYRAWGVSKRARKREKRLEALPPEERDRREAIRLRNKARLEAKNKGEGADSENTGNPGLPVEFDPTIPPRPCTFTTCKNHVPGNSTYKRCDYHRKQNQGSHEKQIAKREVQKAIFKKAIEEGNDPEEALKNWLKEQVEDSGDESDDSAQDEGAEKEGAEKAKFKNRKANDAGTSAAARRNRDNAHICSSKDCQNLLQPDATWRVCEICRWTDQINKKQKAAAARRSTSAVDSRRTTHASPAPPKDLTTDMDGQFQITTPATYATPPAPPTFPSLFTWSAAPSFTQLATGSSSSSSQRPLTDFASTSSSTLSMALQPTPSIAQHEAQRNLENNNPQTTTTSQQSMISENRLDDGNTSTEVDASGPSVIFEDNTAPIIDGSTSGGDADAQQSMDLREDTSITAIDANGQSNGGDSTFAIVDDVLGEQANAVVVFSAQGELSTSAVNSEKSKSIASSRLFTNAPLPSREISSEISTANLPVAADSNPSQTGPESASASSVTSQAVVALATKSKKPRSSKATSKKSKQQQQPPLPPPPAPYMYPYHHLPPGVPFTYPPPPLAISADGSAAATPYAPPYAMPMPPTPQTQGDANKSSSTATPFLPGYTSPPPPNHLQYPYPYGMPPPSSTSLSGSGSSAAGATAPPLLLPYSVPYTAPDGTPTMYPPYPGYPYPFSPYPGTPYPHFAQPPHSHAQPQPSATKPKAKPKKNVPGSSVFSLNSKDDSAKGKTPQNVAAPAANGNTTPLGNSAPITVSNDRIAAPTSTPASTAAALPLLNSINSLNATAGSSAEAARMMDLSKVAAAEQYVRALMSRPTTPTVEVTPLSLSTLPADRMPAPDKDVSTIPAENPDITTDSAIDPSESLKRKAQTRNVEDGDEFSERHSKAKSCASEKCSSTVPASSSNKYCRDCRTKMKLKKKMTETKKRLKLVGKSNQKSFEGFSARISNIGTREKTTGSSEMVHDDVDAEGDADDEGNDGMQVQS